MDTTETRRHDLQKNYYFLCKCVRCLDEKEPIEMNAAACPNQKCDEFIEFDSINGLPTKCNRCNEKITEKHYQQFKEITQATRLHLDSLKMSNVACKQHASIIQKTNFYHSNYSIL